MLYLMRDSDAHVQAMQLPSRLQVIWSWLSQRWWTPLLPAAVLMLIGFVRLTEASTVANSLYGYEATRQLAWSDIISFYGRPALAHHAFPYTSGHSFEYPVLTGLVFYLAGFAGYSPDVMPAFVANYVLLAASGLVLVLLIIRMRGAKPWLFALAPALILYTGLNWDLLALLPGIAALLLYRQRRDLLATVLLTISVWLKFFAILWLPIVLFERLRRREWEECLKMTGLFTVLSLAINLPFILNDRTEWATFFTFNQNRPPEVNFWTIIRDYHIPIDTINLVTTLSVVAVLAGIFWIQWQHHSDLTLPAAAFFLVWYFFIGKVYSPQYFIWIAAFLAILAAPLWLALSLWFMDLIYYVASFQILHVCASGCTPQLQSFSNWDFNHVLEPAMELREATFIVLLLWVSIRFFYLQDQRSERIGPEI